LLLVLCFLIIFTVLFLRDSGRVQSLLPQETKSGSEEPAVTIPPISTDSHPIRQLIGNAEKDLGNTLKRQSKTLDEAVAEYKRRYKLPPPPHFDKWYQFAKSKDLQLIDEFDTIYHSLLPFWGVSPSAIRNRTREAIGFKNSLMGVLIRNGEVVNTAGAADWQQEATSGMMQGFVKYLPDMDLAFNVHDEPRVIIPHDDLSRLVKKATDEALPAALRNPSPKNAWSSRPADIDDGKQFPEVRTTRFNQFAHQAIWTHSRASCPPDSPSRSLEEQPADNQKSYSFSPLKFIQNHTAFTDICSSPSLRETHGFFDRPNAFDVVQDLFPVFSQSKMSSYQDIIYPSPWYWANKVEYSEDQDQPWNGKENKLYWRGSTTGGYSRMGGWRRQHRQGVVRRMNALDKTAILATDPSRPNGTMAWVVQEVPRLTFKELFDVRFSHVGQCDEGDCAGQREFFQIADSAPQEAAWRYKYLLDMDGNAFSGRFYAFLRSHSAVVKMAVFREWHEEWVRPWVHYAPVGLHGDEYAEVMRYFDREEDGRVEGRVLAERGRTWAGKVLRNEDFEVWFFRLLLEFGRVVDDDRENIGYGGGA
jgi:hypothetical protein